MSAFVFFQPKVSGLSDIIVSTTQPQALCVSFFLCAQTLVYEMHINSFNFLAARTGAVSLYQLDTRLQDSCARSWGLYTCGTFFHSLALMSWWSLIFFHRRQSLVTPKDNLWVVLTPVPPHPLTFCLRKLTLVSRKLALKKISVFN